jgi:hypothetical protein
MRQTFEGLKHAPVRLGRCKHQSYAHGGQGLNQVEDVFLAEPDVEDLYVGQTAPEQENHALLPAGRRDHDLGALDLHQPHKALGLQRFF